MKDLNYMMLSYYKMHKIPLLLLLLSLSTYANEPLTLLAPKTNLLKDENITLTLKPLHVNPKDITWIIEPKNSLHVNNLTITPVQDTTITLRAKYKNKLSNKLILHVKWIVNGHTLPPMPDEKINNSTLLGIDVNENGVRDDVERWIYETYKDKHPIHIDIAMQAGRAYKKVLQMPEKALEIHDEVIASIYCEWYYANDAVDYNESLLINKREDIDSKTKGRYFNTKQRANIYRNEYDRRLSGGSYPIPRARSRKQLCDFNTSKYDKNED